MDNLFLAGACDVVIVGLLQAHDSSNFEFGASFHFVTVPDW
jgi:hypothetical protein